MQWKKIIAPVAAGGSLLAGGAFLHASEPSEARGTPGSAIVETRAAAAPAARLVRGEAIRRSRGDLSLYVPDELAVRGGAFDLVVHFHGDAKNQQVNVDEAKLPAAVVSANEGGTAETYAKAFANGDLSRIVKLAEDEVGAGRVSGARVGRIALSAWSAGGGAVKHVLQKNPDGIDAVLLADGLFSSWEDAAKTKVRLDPLSPFIELARRAVNDERLLVITHTAIPTDYPNVEACTGTLLRELGIDEVPGGATMKPSGGAPAYAVHRGSFHVMGTDGKGPGDHIEQLRKLDEAYAELGRRWAR